MIERAAVELVSAAVVVGTRPNAGICRARVVEPGAVLRIGAGLTARTGVGRIDRRGADGQVQVSAGRIREPGTGLNPVRLLSGRGLECGQ